MYSNNQWNLFSKPNNLYVYMCKSFMPFHFYTKCTDVIEYYDDFVALQNMVCQKTYFHMNVNYIYRPFGRSRNYLPMSPCEASSPDPSAEGNSMQSDPSSILPILVLDGVLENFNEKKMEVVTTILS